MRGRCPHTLRVGPSDGSDVIEITRDPQTTLSPSCVNLSKETGENVVQKYVEMVGCSWDDMDIREPVQ